MNASTNKAKSLSFSLFTGVVLAGLSGCVEAPADAGSDAPVRVVVAPLANDGCEGPRPTGLPAEIDLLEAELRDEAGWSVIERVARADGLEVGQVLLQGVPVGDAVELRFVACEGTTPRFLATPAPFPLDENAKRSLALHFKALGRLSCTGTALGNDYDRYAALGRPRAFAATAPLPDGRLLVAGGALEVRTEDIDGDDNPDVVLDALPTAGTDDAGWDVYDPTETLFLPGVDRQRPLSPRGTLTPRVAAQAWPFVAPSGVRGVLVAGGSARVQWDPGAQGPLRPLLTLDGFPLAEFFDPETGAFARVEAPLLDRFLPGGASVGGRVVLVGGLERPEVCPGGACPLQPSAAVEVVDAAGLTRLDLPAALLGPTVTPLSSTTLLAWGADVTGCGARPGWLIELSPVPTVRPLSLQAPQPAPNCQAQPAECRAWYVTAHHTATALPPGPAPERRPRVLVTGGVAISGDGLVPNPDQGAACRPNAFVLEVDLALGSATLTPVELADDLTGQLAKRALHTAARSGDDVLLAGGWLNSGTPTALAAGDQVLIYENDSGRLRRAADTLSSPRLGHVGAALGDGTVVLAGGVRRGVNPGEFELLPTAEVYVPPLAHAACLPTADAGVSEASAP